MKHSDLSTARLNLQHIQNSDIEFIFQGLSDPKVIKYYGVNFKTLEETQEQMDWYRGLVENGTGIWWKICQKENGTFLGAGGLNDLISLHRKAELGFWLLPQYWGKGIMVEGCQAILDYGFNKMNLNRIEGFVESDNQNCKRALAKLNFSYEGTMKEWELKDGKYIDVDIFARLSPDRN